MKPIRDHQLYQLTKTLFLETLREPETLFWGIVFPVLISIGLGLAFTQTSTSKLRIAVVKKHETRLDSLLRIYATTQTDDGQTTHTWTIADKTLGNTELSFIRSNWKDAIVQLKRGEADVILTDSAGQVTYHLDPHNSQAQLTSTTHLHEAVILDEVSHQRGLTHTRTAQDPNVERCQVHRLPHSWAYHPRDTKRADVGN